MKLDAWGDFGHLRPSGQGLTEVNGSFGAASPPGDIVIMKRFGFELVRAPHGLVTSLVVLTFALALGAGCSSDDAAGPAASDPSGEGDAAAPDPGVHRPEGPAPRIVERLPGGEGVLIAAASARPLPSGWIEEELFLEGTAVSFRAEGDLPGDGRFELREDASADYRTRIVVRRPGDPGAFNGTVVVEWMNVSGGFDANPDFAYMADELFRGGYAWVGVSAQHIGIEGGPVLVSVPGAEEAGAGQGIRALDPARYGSLSHPGDAFAYDIFTQVARSLRARGTDGALGDLEPTRLLAVGESQSGFMLTTYVNGMHRSSRQYDGFFIHSRGGGTAPLGQAGAGIDLVSGITGAVTRVRDDLEEPVLMVQTETDMLFVINYFPARQPDTDWIRAWEIAGTAHADAYLLGEMGDMLGCAAPINAGPHHFIVRAGLRHLDRWAAGGEAPPEAPRLEIDASLSEPVFVRDADGIALGGIRTPQVDVPVDVHSGAPAGGSLACTLFGSTTPLPSERLAELYASPEAYLEAYAAAADAAIDAGFVLEAEREALMADADPSRLAP
jgi:hypothetical protein